MSEFLKDAGQMVTRQSMQGIIVFLLVITLCYVMVFGNGSDFKDLFGYAVSTGIGFYFGRETKTHTEGI